jgi:hypothetical protein
MRLGTVKHSKKHVDLADRGHLSQFTRINAALCKRRLSGIYRVTLGAYQGRSAFFRFGLGQIKQSAWSSAPAILAVLDGNDSVSLSGLRGSKFKLALTACPINSYLPARNAVRCGLVILRRKLLELRNIDTVVQPFAEIIIV